MKAIFLIFLAASCVAIADSEPRRLDSGSSSNGSNGCVGRIAQNGSAAEESQKVRLTKAFQIRVAVTIQEQGKTKAGVGSALGLSPSYFSRVLNQPHMLLSRPRFNTLISELGIESAEETITTQQHAAPQWTYQSLPKMVPINEEFVVLAKYHRETLGLDTPRISRLLSCSKDNLDRLFNGRRQSLRSSLFLSLLDVLQIDPDSARDCLLGRRPIEELLLESKQKLEGKQFSWTLESPPKLIKLTPELVELVNIYIRGRNIPIVEIADSVKVSRSVLTKLMLGKKKSIGSRTLLAIADVLTLERSIIRDVSIGESVSEHLEKARKEFSYDFEVAKATLKKSAPTYSEVLKSTVVVHANFFVHWTALQKERGVADTPIQDALGIRGGRLNQLRQQRFSIVRRDTFLGMIRLLEMDIEKAFYYAFTYDEEDLPPDIPFTEALRYLLVQYKGLKGRTPPEIASKTGIVTHQVSRLFRQPSSRKTISQETFLLLLDALEIDLRLALHLAQAPRICFPSQQPEVCRESTVQVGDEILPIVIYDPSRSTDLSLDLKLLLSLTAGTKAVPSWVAEQLARRLTAVWVPHLRKVFSEDVDNKKFFAQDKDKRVVYVLRDALRRIILKEHTYDFSKRVGEFLIEILEPSIEEARGLDYGTKPLWR